MFLYTRVMESEVIHEVVKRGPREIVPQLRLARA
jgi:hypothetical protein